MGYHFWMWAIVAFLFGMAVGLGWLTQAVGG